MQFRIGIENNVEGRSQAWALEHPGCFSYGEHGNAAFSAMPTAILEYSKWLDVHSQGKGWLNAEEIELFLEETWEVYAIDERFEFVEQGYEVNAWFRYDWKPLTDEDISRTALLLSFSRDDLLTAVSDLSQSDLVAHHANERWSIEGILEHVSNAEWWYLDRLGFALSNGELPLDAFARLEIVRARLMEILPTLSGLKRVVGLDGEFWSPRKMLRRAAWHERDHTFHIQRLKVSSGARV